MPVPCITLGRKLDLRTRTRRRYRTRRRTSCCQVPQTNATEIKISSSGSGAVCKSISDALAPAKQNKGGPTIRVVCHTHTHTHTHTRTQDPPLGSARKLELRNTQQAERCRYKPTETVKTTGINAKKVKQGCRWAFTHPPAKPCPNHVPFPSARCRNGALHHERM